MSNDIIHAAMATWAAKDLPARLHAAQVVALGGGGDEVLEHPAILAAMADSERRAGQGVAIFAQPDEGFLYDRRSAIDPQPFGSFAEPLSLNPAVL